MARRDGTGPMGRGPLTGRGLGVCNDGYGAPRGGAGYNRGMGMRAGKRGGTGPIIGRNFAYGPVEARSQKDLLDEEIAILKDRLNQLEEELKNL